MRRSRVLRWNPTANRWASSRTRWTSCRTGDDRGSALAGLVTFQVFLGLLPLLVVALTVFGGILEGSERLQEAVLDSTLVQFPVLGARIEDDLSALTVSGPILYLSILGLVWTSFGIYHSLQLALNQVWNVTGAVATASGPHPGASEDVERLGVAITETVYVHVRVAAVFGIGVLVVGFVLWRIRDAYPGVFKLWAVLLAVLSLQAILGEVQYRNALPWGLVLVHVCLAALIWAGSVALVHVLWRPPGALTRR